MTLKEQKLAIIAKMEELARERNAAFNERCAKQYGWEPIPFQPYPDSFKEALLNESLQTLTNDLKAGEK